MRKILCYGSMNIDHVYEMDAFVTGGATVFCKSHNIFPGGKGFNQAIALARAGCPTWFAGKYGKDAAFMLDMLKAENVDISLVHQSGNVSGHTVIQVDSTGQNCIIVCPGANSEISRAEIDGVLESFAAGDFILLQNEISELPYIIAKSVARGLKVYLNPSPISTELLADGFLAGITGLILNEIEGQALTGQTEPGAILAGLYRKNPAMEVILTLGDQGVIYSNQGRQLSCRAVPTSVVDTTAAGDTFTGYFLAGRLAGHPVEIVLRDATRAASITVSRPGAAMSIPRRREVFEDTYCSHS